MLRKLPGRRLFQYRNEDGDVRFVTAQDVNRFLREIADEKISLKDFRTLLASVTVLDALAARRRRRASAAAASRCWRRSACAATDLANTPAICAKSYVHEAVVTAFEDGILEQFAETLRNCRSAARREKVLAEVMATPPRRLESRFDPQSPHPAGSCHRSRRLPEIGSLYCASRQQPTCVAASQGWPHIPSSRPSFRGPRCAPGTSG